VINHHLYADLEDIPPMMWNQKPSRSQTAKMLMVSKWKRYTLHLVTSTFL